jgi:hypothetical protein
MNRVGWTGVPNASATSSATGTKVQYAINSKGLRDDETDYTKPPGTPRIVLHGDTRTFGYGVPIAQHFSKLLEGYFRAVEVINMGVSGDGVDQELLAFSQRRRALPARRGDRLRGASGISGTCSPTAGASQKPQFQLRDGEVVLTNVPAPSEYAGLDLPHRRDAVAILRQLDRETTAAGAHFVLVTQLPRLCGACIGLGMTSFDVSAPLQNPRFDPPDGLATSTRRGMGDRTLLERSRADPGLAPRGHPASRGCVLGSRAG